MVFRIVSIASLTMLAPALVGLVYGEVSEVLPFLIVSSASFAITFTLSLLLPAPSTIALTEAAFISSISWIAVALLGAVPYVLTIGMSWIDAFFESMSGFSTTGMTLIKVIEAVPKSVLFWRALTQWLGGTGIIMLFLIFVIGPTESVSLWRLYVAEARELRIKPSTWATVRSIWIIYLGYTIACTLTLMLLGLDWFDAVTHSFTALATGGFSTRTDSVAAFHNPSVEMALAFFTFVGGTNFLAHYILFVHGPKQFFKHYEVKATMAMIAISTLIMTFDLTRWLGVNLLEALRLTIFQTVSIMTTTGYTTSNIDLWPPLSKTVLLLLMFVGGSLCSTGGAIKVGRVVAALKVMVNQVQLLFLPAGALKPVKLGNQVLRHEDILRLFMFISAYLVAIVAGTLMLTAFGYDPFQAFSAVVSAQGNVGPCYMDLFKLNDVCRVVLALFMWLGRLELVPVMALLLPSQWDAVLRRRVAKH
ncbi:MAG: TrkH family potassium uptake protein [Zestosphaera sp.]